MTKSNWAVGLDGVEVDDLGDALEDIADARIEPNPESTQRDPAENPFEKMTIHDLMVRMRRGLVEDLLARLEDGTATHQELAIIQRMLNDAGYVVDREPETGGGPSSSNKTTAPMGLPDLEEDYE